MFTVGLRQDSSGFPEPASEGLRTENQPRLTPETRRVKTPPHAPTLHGARCTETRTRTRISCDQDRVGSCPSGPVQFLPCSFSHFSTLPELFLSLYMVYMYIFCIRDSPREMTINILSYTRNVLQITIVKITDNISQY